MVVTGLRKFLILYAPDFCWCSAYDLMIMMEQESHLEEVGEDSFKVTLSRLKNHGWFITKETTYRPDHNSHSKIGCLYLRVK